MQFDEGTEVKLYLRDAARYKELAEKHGLELVQESYPSFTREYLEQYPIGGPIELAPYLILGFRKIRSTTE